MGRFFFVAVLAVASLGLSLWLGPKIVGAVEAGAGWLVDSLAAVKAEVAGDGLHLELQAA